MVIGEQLYHNVVPLILVVITMTGEQLYHNVVPLILLVITMTGEQLYHNVVPLILLVITMTDEQLYHNVVPLILLVITMTAGLNLIFKVLRINVLTYSQMYRHSVKLHRHELEEHFV